MIFLELVLMAAGFFANLPVLWVIGGIITAGLHALGVSDNSRSRNCETCHGARQYRHYFPAEDDSIGAMEEGDNWDGGPVSAPHQPTELGREMRSRHRLRRQPPRPAPQWRERATVGTPP
jgi:hypothetical protein